MRHVGNATISPHLCGKDVLSSVILDCKQIIIFGYLGLQANNYLCLSRIAKLRTDFSILSPWCTLHECLRRRRCTALILHDRVFLLFLFRNFLVSRFVAEHTLILAQVVQSGAERDQQLVFSFLLFSSIFALFAHFRTLVLQCLVTSVWALIYCFCTR